MICDIYFQFTSTFLFYIKYSVYLSDEFCGEDDHLEITALLKDGKGSNAWQHTQLFRTSLEKENFIGFDIDISLEETKI